MAEPYSVPASATTTSNGMRSTAQAVQTQQVAPPAANDLFGIPLGQDLQRPPTMHKIVPSEGPKAGGVEVICLGSGFYQGLEVMFGESKATTTTFWGETSLACLLPPSAFSGTVAVTFKHHHQQQPMQPYPTSPIPKQQAFFKYVDDDEQQLIRTALSVLGHKMTGKMEDVRDLARRIVGDGNSSWGASASQSPSGGAHQVFGFNAATFGVEVEATILKCLDLIDLDDSPNMPRLNLRRSSGQTMLHLACSLGLNRVVAALLGRGANPEPRDKGGFTPIHFAALHNHPQIVRRLLLSGADPTVRSLQGYIPSDMATSEEVLRATRRIEHHSRTRSGSSLTSRTSSATSLRSVWEPDSTPAPVDDDDLGKGSDDNDNEYEAEDADTAQDGAFWMRSRRPSAQKSPIQDVADEKDPVLELPGIGATGGLPSPTAAMSAFRDQLSAQIAHLQQTMHLNLPNLPQMPRFDMMPTLPDYQAYLPTAPMVRRISNLVSNNRPDSAKEQDYKWWDLFSGNVPAAPPAYEDIFPQGDIDVKRASAVQAAADTVADNKYAELFDQAESSTTAQKRSAQKRSVKLETVRIGQKHTITREQQDRLRLAHAEKVKRLRQKDQLWLAQYFHPLAPFKAITKALRELLMPPAIVNRVLFVQRRIQTTWNKITRSKVQQGYKRIEWTCEDCGETICGDFDNSDPQAVNEMAAALQCPISQNSTSSGTEISNFETSLSAPSNAEILPQSGLGRNDSNVIQEQCASPKRLVTPSASTTTSAFSYLALCVNTGEFRKSLVEIEVSKFTSDQQLFKQMKSSYRDLRGIKARFSFLIKPVSMRFVHFNLFHLRGAYVGFCDLDKPCSIPESDVPEYKYDPVPLKPLPPMPAEVFMHYLQYGDAENVHRQNHWLRRLPTRLKRRIIDSPEIPAWGWGIYIIEGPNRPVIFWITMTTVFASILAAVLWSSLRDDVQGGTGLGAMAIALPPVIMTAFLFRLTTD